MFLLGASTVHAQTAGLQPENQLTVVDARGKRVGIALWGETSRIGHPLWVALRVDGGAFLIGVDRNGFRSVERLSFESNDCSGIPFIDTPYPDQLLPYSTLLLGNKQLLSQTLGRFPGLLTSTQYSWTGFLTIVFGGTVQRWPLRLYL